MKILVTTTPGLGHINPVLPLAQALVRRGDDVRWATGADACAHIEAAGVKAVACGLTGLERHAEYRNRYPEWQDLSPQDLPAHMFPRLFGAISMPRMLEDLMPVVDESQPDLILHEVGELAAPIVAGVLGTPHVTQGFGARLRPERLHAVAEYVEPYWRRAGIEPRPSAGSYDYLYLDIYPPSLDPGYRADVGTYEPLRPVAVSEQNGDGLSEWLARNDDRPLVYLTFGTVFNATAGGFAAAVEALVDIDVRALVTVGPRGDVTAFGSLPERIVVANYVPQHLTLQHCSAVVSHGGSGTFLATLARGLPQVCLPQAADQFSNATACATAGAGVALSPQTAERSSVKDAIVDVLSDARYRERARSLAVEIAAMPSPDDVASVIASRFAPRAGT